MIQPEMTDTHVIPAKNCKIYNFYHFTNFSQAGIFGEIHKGELRALVHNQRATHTVLRQQIIVGNPVNTCDGLKAQHKVTAAHLLAMTQLPRGTFLGNFVVGGGLRDGGIFYPSMMTSKHFQLKTKKLGKRSGPKFWKLSESLPLNCYHNQVKTWFGIEYYNQQVSS